VCAHERSSRRRSRGPPCCGGFHRVGLDEGGRRLGVASHTGADLGAALVVDAEPRAILAPGLVGGLPGRQIVGQQAPGTAGAQHILEALEPLAQGVVAGATPGVFRWQEGLQALPLLGGSIRGRGQALGGHGRFSLPSQAQSWTEVAPRP
jgi:hypothetical protein